MKIKLIIISLICITISACETITHGDPMAYAPSRVSYLKNTLDYSINVQCLYISETLNPTKDSLICQEELLTIAPGEQKVILDYFAPQYARIYETAEGNLLCEYSFFRSSKLADSTPELLPSYEEEKKIGSKLDPTKYPYALLDFYFINNDKYLLEEIPFPIWHLYGANGAGWKVGKDELAAARLYETESNGHALVDCYVTNPEAECFK